jgi:hypothetical protein
MMRSSVRSTSVTEEVVGGGNDDRPYYEEQENDEIFHGRAAVEGEPYLFGVYGAVEVPGGNATITEIK